MDGANTWEYATGAQREAFRARVRELAPQVDVTQRRTRAELAAIEVLKWP